MRQCCLCKLPRYIPGFIDIDSTFCKMPLYLSDNILELFSQGDSTRILLAITELWRDRRDACLVLRVLLWSFTSSLESISTLAACALEVRYLIQVHAYENYVETLSLDDALWCAHEV